MFVKTQQHNISIYTFDIELQYVLDFYFWIVILCDVDMLDSTN